MEKKVTRHQDKQAKLLSELIDTKIEARAARIERTVAKLYKLFKYTKASTSPKRMNALERRVASLKEVLEDFNVKNLEGDIFKRFNQINKTIATSLEEQRKTIENTEIEISTLKKNLDEFQTFDKEFMNLDTASLKRDIESLKTKTQWLELEMEKMNIRPLLEKIRELEARIDALKLSQPMIIE